MCLHRARKRFGQNFLVDDEAIFNIISFIKPNRDDFIVEIGPGLSAITYPLSNFLNSLICIEIDRDLVKILQRKFLNSNIKIIEADVLDFDFRVFNSQLRLVGNLPYNISSQFLFKIMDFSDCIMDGHFMLQKEVVDRMIAIPSTSDYGRLSVMLQERYKIEKLFDIKPESFSPQPKVFSSFVRIVPLPDSRIIPKSYIFFQKLVKKSFSQKRKMLKNALGSWSDYINWDNLELDSKVRAEDVSVDKFIIMSDMLYEHILD